MDKTQSKRGLFITFEGGEGSGKTTQIQLLAQKLQQNNISQILTREPGGTEIGKSIRQLLLSSQSHSLLPMTELLLYSADRYQHVSEIILPSLDKGIWVLSDRFVDSTWVYQGYARGIETNSLDYLCNLASQGLKPDMTFLLDLPAEIGLERSKKRLQDQKINEGRFEEEGLSFHQKVRDGFLQLSQKEKKRFYVINASNSAEKVHQDIWQNIQAGLENSL